MLNVLKLKKTIFSNDLIIVQTEKNGSQCIKLWFVWKLDLGGFSVHSFWIPKINYKHKNFRSNITDQEFKNQTDWNNNWYSGFSRTTHLKKLLPITRGKNVKITYIRKYSKNNYTFDYCNYIIWLYAWSCIFKVSLSARTGKQPLLILFVDFNFTLPY